MAHLAPLILILALSRPGQSPPPSTQPGASPARKTANPFSRRPRTNTKRPEKGSPDQRGHSPHSLLAPRPEARSSRIRRTSPGPILKVRPWVPWVMGAAAGVLWLGLEMVKRRVGPKNCLVCNGPAQGPPRLLGPDKAFRSALRARNTERADRVSSILAFGVLPAISAGSVLLVRRDSWRTRLQDLSLLYEALSLSSLLQQITCLAVARRRPEATFHRVDDNVGFENTSFFSGHTTLAFTLASTATTLLWIRHNRWTWLVAVLGFSAATAVGALRIAADKHYVSDVLVGALVGTATGVLVPRLSLRW